MTDIQLSFCFLGIDDQARVSGKNSPVSSSHSTCFILLFLIPSHFQLHIYGSVTRLV
jgi:hypothetical protein